MAIQRHTVYHGRNVKADFKLNRDGFRKIAVGPELRAAVHDVVERHAMPIAKSLAADFSNTGTYLRSFYVDDTTVVETRDWPMRRASGRLVNNAKHPGSQTSYALLVEVGDARFAGHHVFTKTLEQMVALGLVSMSQKTLRALARRHAR